MENENINLIKLYNEIETDYHAEQHEEFIRKFRKYINISNVGISKLMIFKYIYALIETDKIDEALNLLKKVFKMNNFIETEPLSNRKLYLIGRMLYDKEYYDDAKIVLEKYLELNKDADYKYIRSASNWLVEIERHNEGYFNKTFAKAYLKDGKRKIEPGLVVYLKYSSSVNKKEENPIYNRPYLVWKVEQNKVYSFPITTINKNNTNPFYIANDNIPRFLETEIITFDIEDIESIYRKLNSENLGKILEKQYYRFCCSQQKNPFILEYEKNFNIKLYDIITIKDANGIKKEYLITNIDYKKQEYIAKEILRENSMYTRLSAKETTINFNYFIYSAISFENFFNVYKDNMFGKNETQKKLLNKEILVMLIEHNNQIYKVLYQDTYNYVCVPNNDSTYTQITKINKNDNIKFIKMENITDEKENIKKIVVNELINKSQKAKNTTYQKKLIKLT